VFWKFTSVFSWTADAHQTDGWGPDPDGALRTVSRVKIRHYRQLYINLPEPIDFIPVTVDTSGRIYEDFSRLLFLHTHREVSAIPEESEQFRFLRAACFVNIKGSVGLILAKVSTMWISIPLDLSSRPFIPLPRFIRSRRATPRTLSSFPRLFSSAICLLLKINHKTLWIPFAA
jgi:hypothetical protein